MAIKSRINLMLSATAMNIILLWLGFGLLGILILNKKGVNFIGALRNYPLQALIKILFIISFGPIGTYEALRYKINKFKATE